MEPEPAEPGQELPPFSSSHDAAVGAAVGDEVVVSVSEQVALPPFSRGQELVLESVWWVALPPFSRGVETGVVVVGMGQLAGTTGRRW